jgi:aminomethyltransferase
MEDPGIPRHGYQVKVAGETAGAVTSGTYGPYVKKSIGLVYLPTASARPGTRFHVAIRGREARAVVVPTPFYRRSPR